MTERSSSRIEHPIGTDGLFVLRLRSGAVHLRGTDGETAVVGDRHNDDLEADFLVERGEGSLSISRSKGLRIKVGARHQGSADLSVDLPRRATVVVEAGSADLTAEGLEGDQRYQTVSGDVALQGVQGRVAVDAVSGDVRLSASGSLGLEVRTVSGDVEARAGRLEALTLATTSGDVAVAGELSAGGEHRLETVSGDAKLALVGGVRVEASTVTGDVTSDVPHRAEGSRGRRVIVIGDGAATLRASSMSGDIRIVRARPFDPGGDRDQRDARATATAAPASTTPAPAPTMAVIQEPPGATQATNGPSDAAIAAAYEDARLGILRSLERGEIDVTEAGRRLEALDLADVPEGSIHG